MLNIVHRGNSERNKTFANIDTVFRDTSPTKYTPDGSYVRALRHPPTPAETGQAFGEQEADYDDEPVPF